MRQFVPLFRNPHLLTILGNFWPREYDFGPYRTSRTHFRTDPDTEVLIVTHETPAEPVGEVVLLHGLEGTADSGYIKSMAWHCLQAGLAVHCFHMRTCGGTEKLCKTLYHAGLTSDARAFLEHRRCVVPETPLFAIGFSLGGNVALKLAGELGENNLLRGVVAISTPIDLAACAERLRKPDNFFYERRFVRRMQARLAATGRYSMEEMTPWRSIYEMDDHITAPSFGFGTADNYYATQSSRNFLESIRVPSLCIQAKDDTFIPFDIFDHKAFRTNSHLRLLATEHGGHIGFLHRSGQRFWETEVAVEFLTSLVPAGAGTLTSR